MEKLRDLDHLRYVPIVLLSPVSDSSLGICIFGVAHAVSYLQENCATTEL